MAFSLLGKGPFLRLTIQTYSSEFIWTSSKKSPSSIPVDFSTKIPAKTIALFQDANPESAVVIYDVNKYDLTDYSVKIKMGKSGTITVIVEGQDGKLYGAKKTLEVALGGCEG